MRPQSTATRKGRAIQKHQATRTRKRPTQTVASITACGRDRARLRRASAAGRWRPGLAPGRAAPVSSPRATRPTMRRTICTPGAPHGADWFFFFFFFFFFFCLRAALVLAAAFTLVAVDARPPLSVLGLGRRGARTYQAPPRHTRPRARRRRSSARRRGSRRAWPARRPAPGAAAAGAAGFGRRGGFMGGLLGAGLFGSARLRPVRRAGRPGLDPGPAPPGGARRAAGPTRLARLSAAPSPPMAGAGPTPRADGGGGGGWRRGPGRTSGKRDEVGIGQQDLNEFERCWATSRPPTAARTRRPCARRRRPRWRATSRELADNARAAW